MRDAHPEASRVEVWLQDEARVGQQGTLTRVWAERGSRPAAVKQTEYEWAYLFAAVNPATGASSALIASMIFRAVERRRSFSFLSKGRPSSSSSTIA